MLKRLVSAIGAQSPGGISASRLAAETRFTQRRVEVLLATHTEYFVRVGGGGSYALNRFSGLGGSVERIVDDIERGYAKGQQRKRLLAILLPILLVIVGALTLFWMSASGTLG